jgi:AraC-like DNA-binding protein
VGKTEMPSGGASFQRFIESRERIQAIVDGSEFICTHSQLVIPRQTNKNGQGISKGFSALFRGGHTMNPIPLVRQVTIAPAVSYLAAEGVPVHRYLRRAKLRMPSPDTLETLVPLHQVCDFLSSVARAEGIQDLGFRVVGAQGTEHLGIYGKLLAQSLTLHEMIQTTLEFIASYNSGLHIWIERHQDQVRYCQKFEESLSRDRITEAVHFGLASAMACAKYARGATWLPNRIELASAPIDLSMHFPELADLPLVFDQPQTSIWLDQKVLSAPLPRFRSSPVTKVEGDKRASFIATAPAPDPIGQLKQVIESALGHPELNLQFIGAIIGMSPRTLQRRLAEQDQSFSLLLKSVRFQSALRMLQDPVMPLTRIAKRLGYTDLANFIRAFKRWTGVSPNEYRRLHYEHGHK